MTSPYWDGAPASPELHQISFKGACVIGRHRMCEAVTADKTEQPRGGHRGRIRDSCRASAGITGITGITVGATSEPVVAIPLDRGLLSSSGCATIPIASRTSTPLPHWLLTGSAAPTARAHHGSLTLSINHQLMTFHGRRPHHHGCTYLMRAVTVTVTPAPWSWR